MGISIRKGNTRVKGKPSRQNNRYLPQNWMHWFSFTLNLLTVSPGPINVEKRIYLSSYVHTEEWRETQRRLYNLPVSITQRNLFPENEPIQVRGDDFKQESSYHPWPFWVSGGNISQHCETTAESGRAQGESCHYCPVWPIQCRHLSLTAQHDHIYLPPLGTVSQAQTVASLAIFFPSSVNQDLTALIDSAFLFFFHQSMGT